MQGISRGYDELKRGGHTEKCYGGFGVVSLALDFDGLRWYRHGGVCAQECPGLDSLFVVVQGNRPTVDVVMEFGGGTG